MPSPQPPARRPQIIAFCNKKPGTAKTTSAVWTAFGLHHLGEEVVLVDTDKSAGTLKWSDLVDGFPFRVVALPSPRAHAMLPDYITSEKTRIVVDTPQMEDHAAIVRSILRIATHVVVPTAPSFAEIERMTTVREAIAEVESLRDDAPDISVLLNRVDTRASSGPEWREALIGDGWDVLDQWIPMLQLYSQSYGNMPKRDLAYVELARQLMARHDGETQVSV